MPLNLEVVQTHYTLIAKTPDAQRFLEGWQTSDFWKALAFTLDNLAREPNPTSSMVRSPFQLERDMQVRAAIDALPEIPAAERKMYLKTVQSQFLEHEGWFSDLNSIVQMNLSDLLSDIGKGGCLETFALILVIACELGEQSVYEAVQAMGEPSELFRAIASLGLGLVDHQRLSASEEPLLLESTLCLALIWAITLEHTEECGAQNVRLLLDSVVGDVASVHPAWQLLLLISWGMTFAQDHDLDVLASAALCPLGSESLRVRHLFWDGMTGLLDKPAMAVVHQIELATDPKEVILKIAGIKWRSKPSRADFSRDYVRTHEEAFLETRLEARHFQNLYDLGISPQSLMAHPDIDDASRESFLAMDLGL